MAYRFHPLRPAGITPQAAPNRVQTTMENLLTHVPGEASGFYLIGLEMIRGASTAGAAALTTGELGGLFACAMVLLVVIRKLAGAGLGLIITSATAFALWMMVFEDGFLNHAFHVEKPVYWLVISAFFTALVTALANAGKLK